MNPPTNPLLGTLSDSGPVLTVLVIGSGLATLLPETYAQWSQEDGPVEWITFWAFFAAAMLAMAVPLRPGAGGRRGPLTTPWFVLLGIGLLAIALEEISWGQRLFAYRPPDVFLESNFQQELNLHNLADADVRGALLVGLLAAFGLAYPLLCRLPLTASRLAALGVPNLPLTITPGFGALILTYVVYPWEYTGEWVELGAGIAFLTAVARYPAVAGPGTFGVAGALAVAAGMLTPLGQSSLTGPARSELAAMELRALAEDFSRKRYRSRCGVHKRLYTFVSEYGGVAFEESALAGLPGDADADERRRYFLDPWNLPYWIRHACSRDRRSSTVYVYSFGPDRRRDSTPDGLAGDDVGAYVNRPSR